MTDTLPAHDRPIRVLHGLTGAASQPSTISRAQRRLGVDADCVLAGSGNKFGYPSDHQLVVGVDEQKSYSDFLTHAIDRYDVFHFYFRPFFYFESRYVHYPTGLDLMVLRAAGKVVIFHYRGSEVRTAKKFRDFSPYHYADEDPNNLISKFPAATVEAFQEYVSGVANQVLVPDAELQSYVPRSEIVPRGIDLELWQPRYETPDMADDHPEGPLVVHAPSRQAVKGTPTVLAAVEQLKREGLKFRFQLIEGLPNDEARLVYERASIIVDQLRIGWYGVLAVEGMALGKPVVSYVREDIQHHLVPDGGEPPIANANPENITAVMRDLLKDGERRRALGRRARAFCEATHDSSKVAADLIERYRRELAHPTPVDHAKLLDYLIVQRNHTKGLYRKAIKRSSVHPTPSTRFWKFMHIAQQSGVREATRVAAGKVKGRVKRALGRG